MPGAACRADSAADRAGCRAGSAAAGSSRPAAPTARYGPAARGHPPGPAPALSSGAMDTPAASRTPAAPEVKGVRLRAPGPGELGWIVQRHGALYAAEYGWNAEFEGLVARIVADFAEDHDPYLERVWIAELDGRPVGSVMCVRDREDGAPGTARLRLLLVDPEGRGRGIGGLLVDTVVAFARSVGYRELVLWTNDVLADARELYLRAGFTLVAQRPHRSYGVHLIGQDWRLPLQEGSPR
ncbi:GNAT family N-acetyltransferase [Streptomyces sp. fd1-xmd]|uniref:GNAT family N-acetyltransferase n=1 Tax=Streptomyces sp. fd1-xmd TaxID=1812480 RepID=UPI00399EE99D